MARGEWLGPFGSRGSEISFRVTGQHTRDDADVSAIRASGCGGTPTRAAKLRSTHCGGLAQSLSRQHAAVVRPSQHAQQPEGIFAKRALRAAAPSIPDTAGCARHTAAGGRGPDVGSSNAEAEK